MQLSLYNTETKKVEPLTPILGNQIKMYCCGPTVYDFAHIGNLRTYIFEDILRKTIKRAGFQIKHVMNITDVGHLTSDADEGEDKMLKAARKTHQDVLDIARRYETEFFKDCADLHIERPDITCRATEHIQDMIAYIKLLEERGFTYFENGNVYFDTSKFPDYGKMAGLDLENLRHGSRVEVDSHKKNPTDFVLWFTKSKFEDQVLGWESPWGKKGYPGWHIECSVMARKYLGDRIDIHCGGVDHIQVHHTNEIAQTEAITQKKWVNRWMHAEFLNVQDAKMSKSSGEFLTLHLLKSRGYDPMHYRYFCLSANYRSTLNFSYEALDAAKAAYDNLTNRVIEIKKEARNEKIDEVQANKYKEQFYTELYNDLGVPKALAVLWNMLRDKNANAATKLDCLLDFDTVFSIGIEQMKEKQLELSLEQKRLIEERQVARQTKDWKKSDELREQLLKSGLIIIDLPEGKYKLSPAPAISQNQLNILVKKTAHVINK